MSNNNYTCKDIHLYCQDMHIAKEIICEWRSEEYDTNLYYTYFKKQCGQIITPDVFLFLFFTNNKVCMQLKCTIVSDVVYI